MRKTPDTLSSQFKNLCLSGEGHGRISFLSGRHLFDYESMTTPEKKEWALAFHYPAIGEKLIKLDYGQTFKGPLESHFLDKLLQNEKLSEHYRKVLREFFHRLGLIIKTHEDFRGGGESFWQCLGSECSYQDIKMTWSSRNGKFFLKFPLFNNYVFHLAAFSKEKYFNRMRFFVQNEKDIGIKRNPLEMILFLNACYQK
ncbi:MAG: hypothetical protein DRQ88_01180 [Epsilonproteobacteria bacterium]|nr:MAG: hypothetical protein DRQ89_05245 [Campylobacterota bacterium]RLA67907.1 MAG: hypothetical protein DRQ88_01180 [Campylobacterota bacterium]